MLSHTSFVSGIYTRSVTEYAYTCDVTVSGEVYGTGGVNRVVRLKHAATGNSYLPDQQSTFDLDQESEAACGYTGVPGDDWCGFGYEQTRTAVVTGSGVADPDASLLALQQYPSTIKVCLHESTVAVNEFAGSLRVVDLLDREASAYADGCVDVNISYATLLSL